MAERRKHRIIDTCAGEVMLKYAYDCDENRDLLDAYIGDNYDDYIGTISGHLDDDDEVLEERLKEEGII